MFILSPEPGLRVSSEKKSKKCDHKENNRPLVKFQLLIQYCLLFIEDDFKGQMEFSWNCLENLVDNSTFNFLSISTNYRT